MEADRELLGTPDGFGRLFERHARAVYNYCFRRTGDWAAAEDLTSVVFLEGWRRRTEVRLHGDSLLPWLYGVATNVLRNRSRSLRRYRVALERLPRGRSPISRTTSPAGSTTSDGCARFSRRFGFCRRATRTCLLSASGQG